VKNEELRMKKRMSNLRLASRDKKKIVIKKKIFSNLCQRLKNKRYLCMFFIEHFKAIIK